MTDDVTLPTPGEVAAMRERHVPKGDLLPFCPTCRVVAPCDPGRLLALVDTLDSTVLDLELANSRIRDRENEGRARLAAVLGECDRAESEDPATPLSRQGWVWAHRIRRAATGEEA